MAVFSLTENMIYKGLNDEEATFLQFVAEKQSQLDAEKKQAEREEVLAYRVSERWTAKVCRCTATDVSTSIVK